MKEIIDIYGEILADVLLAAAVVLALFYVVWESGWMQQLIQDTLLTAC